MATSIGVVFPVLKGEYSSTETYTRMNIVTWNNAVYCAIKTTAGNYPSNTEYWMKWVEGGSGSGGSSVASEVGFDNSISGITGENVQDAIDEVVGMFEDKANKYTTETRTLLANNWQDAGDHFVYDLGIGSEYDAEILPTGTYTKELVDEIAAAGIISNGLNNSLLAYGDKPVSNIPIIIRKVVK